MSFANALDRRRKIESGELWASELAPWLWLGSGRNAENADQLKQNSITHILNVADDVPSFHEASGDFIYSKLNVKDFGDDSGISRVFESAVDFVSGAVGLPRSQGKPDMMRELTGGPSRIVLAIESAAAALPPATNRSRVLVHCANGSNRSATVVIALLMDLLLITLQNAALFVKTKHPPTLPLRDNCEQLMAYERSSRDLECSTLNGPQYFTSIRRSSRGSSRGSSRIEIEEAAAIPSFDRYEKMRAMGLPDGAVMTRMRQDRVSEDIIQEFIAGGNATGAAGAAVAAGAATTAGAAAPVAPEPTLASLRQAQPPPQAERKGHHVHVLCLGGSLTAGYCDVGKDERPWAAGMAAEIARLHAEKADEFNQVGGIRVGAVWSRVEKVGVSGSVLGMVGATSAQLVQTLEENPQVMLLHGEAGSEISGGRSGGSDGGRGDKSMHNVVIIMAGTNDIGPALGRPADVVAPFLKSLRALHRHCHDAGAATVAVNLLESKGVHQHDWRRQLHSSANRAIKEEFGQADGKIHVGTTDDGTTDGTTGGVGTRTIFVDMCSELPYDDDHADLWSADGLHLNEKGYAEFGKRIAPLVMEFVTQQNWKPPQPPQPPPRRQQARRRQRGGSAAGISFDQPDELGYVSGDD
jgi:dual specificity MAP kinase phosphatase